MTALAGDRLDEVKVGGRNRNFPNVAAAVTIYVGAMVSMDSDGDCRPARATATDKVLGVATKRVTNAGSAGAVDGGVDVDRNSLWRMKNSAGNEAITSAHVGRDCFVVDDQTVSLWSAGGTRPRAGKINSVDSDGVFVDFAAEPNLRAIVRLDKADISAAGDTNAEDAPISGVVVQTWTKLGGPITGDDAVVTPKINSVAMTGAAMTVAFTGSAAGDRDYAHPTAANRVVQGDRLIATTDGGSTDTQTLEVYIEIEAD